MRLSYCLAICLVQILFYANANAELPKFVVKVETKNVTSIKDVDTMHVVVTGNHNDGTPIDGKVTLGLNITRKYKWNPNKHLENIKNADMVDGKASFDYHMSELNLEFAVYNRKEFIEIVAQVEETLTGATSNGTATTTIYPNRYNLEQCLSKYVCDYYEVDILQDLVYKITHVDGSELNDTKSPVELTYYNILRPDNYWNYMRRVEGKPEATPPPTLQNVGTTYTAYMNETGYVNFKILLSALQKYEGNTHCYGRKVKYMDEESTRVLSLQKRGNFIGV